MKFWSAKIISEEKGVGSEESWKPGFGLIDTGTDGHVHTSLCGHAKGEMEEYVRAALDKGLDGIIFLEHFETGISYFETTWLGLEDFTFYRKELERLQEKYQGRLHIGIGVETGYNPECPEKIESFLESFSWDRVGLSYHYLKMQDGSHVNVVSRKAANIEILAEAGRAAVIDTYLDGLLEGVQRLNVDVVCHLDAVMRHNAGAFFSQAAYDKVGTIFEVMAAKDVALEINTSGYPLRGMPYPEPGMIRMAMDMGIRLTPGSDAHNPHDVGRYFTELPDYLHGLIRLPTRS